MNALTDLLGPDGASLLAHKSATIDKSMLHPPGPDFVDRVFGVGDRPIPVLRSLQSIFNAGRLAGTGYVSILPVDQGIEHTAGASFAPNPIYFDNSDHAQNMVATQVYNQDGGYLSDGTNSFISLAV